MSLLTVGTVAFDTIETPYGKAEMVVGGACTYISWAASYFTNDINLVSIVGYDFPDEEIEALKARGVSMEGLEIVPDKKSFFWAGKYHENMNQRDTITTDLNVLADFDPTLPDSYKDSQYIMLGNLTPEIQMKVINELSSDPALIVMDTMNFWMDIAMDALKKVIAKVDVLTINDEEARQLSGEYSLVKAAAVIHEMGPKHIVIKKGEHGALLFSENKMFYAPALPLAQVFDPTGAGDTFAGGFIGYLAKTKDTSFENMKRAVIYGSAMASFCVEEFSIDRLKKLDQDQIRERIAMFVNLTDFSL
jgi:sugar/nucleoside kinase (ribokinase family)